MRLWRWRALCGVRCAAFILMIGLWFVPLSARTATTGRAVATETVRDRRADLDALERHYVGRAPAFTPVARIRARQLILTAKKNAAVLSDTDFFLEVARIIALANNGHDSIDPGDSNLLPPTTLPVRLVWMGNDLVVTRALQRYSELAGARVERIGAVTPDELFRRYREYQGGNDAYRRVNMMWLIHNPAVLASMGVVADAHRIPISVELTSGKRETRLLRAISANEAPHLTYPAGLWSTQASPAEKNAGWTGLNITAPLYLQQPDKFFRVAELPQLNGLYIQFRVNVSEPGEPIEPFVAAVSKLLDGRHRNVVLDLRFDTGGDIATTLDLMRRIGRTTRGRIFIITSPYTFSAGIASAAAVLQSGGDKVTIV